MKSSPAPIILAVMLGLLALGAAAMAYFYPASLEDFTGVPSAPPKQTNPRKTGADDLQSRLAALKTPATWPLPADGHHLFISEQYLFYPSLYPTGNYIQKNDGTAITPGKVLISWYQKYGINFTDPDVDREDPDNDGFSNKIEFLNGRTPEEAIEAKGATSTSPLDPAAHPRYIDRVRLQRYDSRPFHIQFLGYQKLNGQDLFQIFLKDVPSSQQPGFKKTGDKLGFENYLVGVFTPNIVTEVDKATGISQQVDKSTLELDKPDIGFKIILPYRQEVDSPESTADLVMLMPSEVGKVIKVARGKTFALPYLTDQQFILIDVKDTGATVRDIKANKELVIPKLILDPSEWDDVPTAAGNAPKSP